MKTLTRRYVLTGAALSLFQMPTFASAQLVTGSEIAAWMDVWMSEAKKTVGTLHLSRFVEPIYYLLKPTIWLPDAAQAHRLPSITVPLGFVTDFATIPKAFCSLLPSDGEYTHPAVVHDYLYWFQITSREAADEIFRIMMEDFRISASTATIIYQVVRAAGGAAWDSNARARAAGEKRVLKRFPEDPLIRWEDWKRLPDVFE